MDRAPTTDRAGRQGAASREETLLGVCAAIAATLGVPALAVRIAFLAAILSLPLWMVIATYVAVALLLELERRTASSPRTAGHPR